MIKLHEAVVLRIWSYRSHYSLKHIGHRCNNSSKLLLCGKVAPKFAFGVPPMPYDEADEYCATCMKIARKRGLIEGEFGPDEPE